MMMCRSLQISDLDNEVRKSKGAEYTPPQAPDEGTLGRILTSISGVCDDVTYNDDDVTYCQYHQTIPSYTTVSIIRYDGPHHQILWSTSDDVMVNIT